MTDASPAAWHPDPYGRHELRYWDGTQWTEHVSSHGKQSVDPPAGAGHVPTVNRATEKVAARRRHRRGRHGGDRRRHDLRRARAGGEPEGQAHRDQQRVRDLDQNGAQIGAVRQVGQSTAKKALRLLGSVDQFFTHKLQVVDMQGNVLLSLTRPAKVVKSKVLVHDVRGTEVGQIVQQNMIGKIRFSLEANGHTYGSINGENWRAWNFNVQDHAGNEVARITKTWEGFAKTAFTTADNFVVQIHRPLEEPLRTLVVASSLAVDTALKQDNRGFG